MATDQTQATPTPVVATTQPNTPVAPAPAQPVPQVGTTSPTAQTPQVAPTPSLLPNLNAAAVYSPTNVQQVLTGSANSYKNMDLGKLEKNIADAQSTAEMNSINIGNQAIANGVISGQRAHQSALDTARINAITGLYNVKNNELKRKEEALAPYKTAFMTEFGYVPKTMGEKEKSMIAKRYQEKYALTVAQAKAAIAKSNSTGNSPQTAISNLNSLLEKAAQMPSGGREWAASVASTYGVKASDVAKATEQNGWETAYRTPMTPAQQLASEQKTQEAEAAKKAVIPSLEDKLATIKNINTEGVGPNWLSRTSPLSVVTGSKAANIANVQRLMSQETLNTLLALKAQGGTLGAISEKELAILQSGASILGGSTVYNDKGQVIGYNLSEKDFKSEIKRMQEATQRVLEAAKSTNASQNLQIGAIQEKNGVRYRKVQGGWEILN